jgi:Cu/Ag efflux pump CusA
VAQVPGIADLEVSEKARNPALSIHLNNDQAAELGISVQQGRRDDPSAARGRHGELLARPDGQNYE